MTTQRESLASRLGFILVSAGCAIGLGNIWRFPFIVGKYGGAIFVLLYLLFLAIMAFPVLMTEMTVGRGSQSNIVHGFHKLASSHKRTWAVLGAILLTGCLLLMMYYTTITGWLLLYTKGYVCGSIQGADAAAGQNFGEVFGNLASNPGLSSLGMILTCLIGGVVCAMGVEKGVENVVKFLMLALFVLILVLAGYAMTLPNAAEGLKFYLLPNWTNFAQKPLETIFAALGQAFFTLSIGIGSMEIFGSYLSWKTSMAKECLFIIILDTFVALSAGLIIFPVCACMGIDVSAGPGLIFISLPEIFQTLPGGQFWGALFFAFLFLAAITTVIAVFENLVAFPIDAKWMGRKASALLVTVAVILLSMPCVLGFGPWKGFQPLGEGTGVLDLEDFIVSQNLLPLGAVCFLVFCGCAAGWGFRNFTQELEAGQSWHFPKWILFYWRFLLPVIILAICILGYWALFFK